MTFSVPVRSSLAHILRQVQWWSVAVVARYDVISSRWSNHFWVKIQVLLYHFQNYWSYWSSLWSCERKHGEHKTGFRVRNVTGTFEKRAPVEHDVNIKRFQKRIINGLFQLHYESIMGFVRIFWKNDVQEAYLPKMSISGQIVSEIIAQLCLENSIQEGLNGVNR